MSNNPTIERLNNYSKFVGVFITKFANLEFHLRRVLRAQLGMTEDVFRIVIGFPRTDDALGKLRKLLPALEDEARREVGEGLDRLTNLSRLRNWIVHYGGSPLDDDNYLVRLKPTERSKATGKNYHLFQLQELYNALRDLHTVNILLLIHLDPEFDDAQGEFRNGLFPWQYIPPELEQSRG